MSQETRPDIYLHIERLILDGLPVGRAQAPYLQAAVEAELARLLAENGLGAQWQMDGAVPGVRANPILLAQGSSPAELGAQIAQSVYGGIGRAR